METIATRIPETIDMRQAEPLLKCRCGAVYSADDCCAVCDAPPCGCGEQCGWRA